jgi:hypothetical protein
VLILNQIEEKHGAAKETRFQLVAEDFVIHFVNLEGRRRSPELQFNIQLVPRSKHTPSKL